MDNKTKKKKNTYFQNYDLYSDANPDDSVRIKYATLKEVKETISKLENLYKKGKRPHNRIVQIVNVLVQRLKVIVKNFNKGKQRLSLSQKYFEFLKDRTTVKTEKERKKLIFRF